MQRSCEGEEPWHVPIVAHSELPTFADLSARGEHVLALAEAASQDIRELHIGLLNMMPDAAFRVTERQFIGLLGNANRIVQVFVHPFTVPGLPRSTEIAEHIDRYYRPFEDLQAEGLDALIVSGANVSNPDLSDEPFWDPLAEVMAWAHEHVTSTLCSCLATHALLQQAHGIRRVPLGAKRWGVFPHRVVDRTHPLLYGANTRFDVPHSRWNEVTRSQLEDAGIRVLVEGEEGDVHLAVSSDGIRTVYLQGHPEYDTESLLKEHKRELRRFAEGELDALPPLPERYLNVDAAKALRDHAQTVAIARRVGVQPPPYPDAAISRGIDNTWADTSTAIFANWLGLVYRLTDVRRGVPFAEGVDPTDPLGRAAARPDPTT